MAVRRSAMSALVGRGLVARFGVGASVFSLVASSLTVVAVSGVSSAAASSGVPVGAVRAAVVPVGVRAGMLGGGAAQRGVVTVGSGGDRPVIAGRRLSDVPLLGKVHSVMPAAPAGVRAAVGPADVPAPSVSMTASGNHVDASAPTVTLTITTTNPQAGAAVEIVTTVSGEAGEAHSYCSPGAAVCTVTAGGHPNVTVTYTAEIGSSSSAQSITDGGDGGIVLTDVGGGYLLATAEHAVSGQDRVIVMPVDNYGPGGDLLGCAGTNDCKYGVSGPFAYIAAIDYDGASSGWQGSDTWSNILWASPANEYPGNPSSDSECQPCHGDPVATVNGSLVEGATDITVGGRGLPLALTRTYRSQTSQMAAGMGNNWAFSYGMTLMLDPVSYGGEDGQPAPPQPPLPSGSPVVVTQEDGSLVSFNRATDGSYSTLPTLHATLTYSAAAHMFTFVRRGSVVFTFSDDRGQLLSVADHDGLKATLGYDATTHLLASVTGPSGRALTFTHNSDGTVASVTEPAGHSVQYAYAGYTLAAVTDRDGRVTRYGYGPCAGAGALDDMGCVGMTSITDPRGGVTSNVFDGYGRVTSQTSPAGRTTTYGYSEVYTNQWGYVQQVVITDADGHVSSEDYTAGQRVSLTVGAGAAAATTLFSYDPSGGVSGTTDPLGHLSTATFNTLGQMTSSTDANGHTSTFTYNAFWEPLVSTAPSGITTTNVYNTAGDLTSTTVAHGGLSRVTKYGHTNTTYPHDLITVTDPANKVTTFGYDSFGDRSSVKDPTGRVTTGAFTLDGWLSSSIDPIGNATSPATAGHARAYSYDNSGDVLSVTDPLGHVKSQTYDGDRNVVTATDGLGQLTTYVYNGDDQLTSTTLPDTTTSTSQAYDPAGFPASSTDGKGKVSTYAVDSVGRLASVTDPMGDITSYGYDLDGRLASVSDPNSHVTTFGYDPVGQQTSVSDGNQHTTTTSYWPDGQVDVVTDANQHPTTYTYDPLGQLAAKTDADNRVTTYTEDLDGRPLTVTTPDSLVTTTGYDAAGRQTSATYSDGTTHKTTLTYDGDGSRASMADASGTTRYSYDADERLTSSTDGAGHVTGDGYDNADRLSTLTYPGTRGSVTYGYNALDEITTVTDWAAHTTTFGYDADGSPTSIAYPNMVSAAYSYDNAERLTSITDTHAGTTLASFGYGYDPASQLTSDATTLAGATTNSSYGYDSATQLTAVPAGTDTIDPAGELTASPATGTLGYDNADQLTTRTQGAAVTGFAYNTRGDRTSITPPTPAPVSTLSYNQADQLTKIATPTATTATYTYNGDGILTAAATTTGTVKLAWDAAGAVPSLLDDGHSTYIYGPTGPLEQANDTSGALSYLHQDQLGSTRLITSPTGTVTATYTYGPYGTTTTHTGTATTTLQYAGQYTDPTTGYQYLRARWYDPTTAQFLTRDPLEAETGTPYAYAANNPITYTDPTGNSLGHDLSSGLSFLYHQGQSAGLSIDDDFYNTYEDIEHHCYEEAFEDGFSAANDVINVGLAVTGVGDVAVLAKEGITRSVEEYLARRAAKKAAEAASGPGSAALDTNVLIRGLDNGELDAVDKALAGRLPNVSPTAASEYLARGSQDALDRFLAERGGSIGIAGTQEGAAGLQAQAATLGRALGTNDALIAHSAMQEGIPLISGDSQLLRFLNAIGYPAEGF